MKVSAGILVYRKKNNRIEILLVHPGGPYWQNKDKNSWSIPKGEITRTDTNFSEPMRTNKKARTSANFKRTNTNNLNSQKFAVENSSQQFASHYSSHKFATLKQTAIREFEEETGLKLTSEDIEKISYLGEVKSQNKIVYVFILEKDFSDNFEVKSNLIEIEWPPKSGKIIKIPEVDKAGYFDLEMAGEKLVNYQKEIIKKFLEYLSSKN